MPTSRILWGTGYENQLILADPLYDLVSDRPPREGSEWAQLASGVEDAWITGRDYELVGEARFLPDAPSGIGSPVSGPLSWQAFLDWARSKNPFRFVPDQTLPGFYVDGCYLVDPMGGFGTLGQDVKRKTPFRFRNPNFDFHAALRGLMFDYAPGSELSDLGFALTTAFARSSLAWYVSGTGQTAQLKQAAANELRDRDYHAGVRGTVFEPVAATNLLDNGSLETDAAGYTLTGGATIARDTAHPFDGTQALKVTTANNASSGVQVRLRSGNRAAVTAAQPYSLSGWIYVPAALVGKQVRVRIEWWNVTPAFISATETTVTLTTQGWQRVAAWGTAATGAVTADLYFVWDSQGVGSYWLDCAQFENSLRPTSTIPTNTATVTRTAETLPQWTWPWAPQPMWMAADYTDFGIGATAGGGVSVISQIGNTFQSGWLILDVGVTLQFFWEPAGQSVACSLSGAPSWLQRAQALGVLFADGSVQAVRRIGAGSDVVGTRSGVTNDPTFGAFSPSTFYFGAPSPNSAGFILHRLRIGAGSPYLATAAALAA